MSDTPPAMGLTGTIATIANSSAVAVMAGLLVWLLTVYVPAEHDRAVAQRRLDEADMAKERNEWRAHADARMERLWQRQMELHKAITDLTTAVNVARR